MEFWVHDINRKTFALNNGKEINILQIYLNTYYVEKDGYYGSHFKFLQEFNLIDVD